MPQPRLPPPAELADERLADKLAYRRGELAYDLRRWQQEIADVEEGRIPTPEDFRRDVALKVRGALQAFEARDGADMLKEATDRLSSGESASPELRKEVKEIREVADGLLGLIQKATAAARGQRAVQDERGGDVTLMADYVWKLGLRDVA